MASLLKKLVVKTRSYRDIFYFKVDRFNLRFLRRITVPTEFQNLSFSSPTRRLRAEMLRGPNREPETREWIEQIPSNRESVLWDIGANVGSFTIFAASRGIRVVAVEPMPHNLLLLAQNIFINHVADKVVLLPLAIASKTGPAVLQLSSVEFGSARHRFSPADSQLRNTFSQFQLGGVSLSDACIQLRLPHPTHLKIDVDGTDDDVVYGAEALLGQVQSICCEFNFDQVRVAKLVDFLEERGLVEVGRSRRNLFFSRREISNL